MLCVCISKPCSSSNKFPVCTANAIPSTGSSPTTRRARVSSPASCAGAVSWEHESPLPAVPPTAVTTDLSLRKQRQRRGGYQLHHPQSTQEGSADSHLGVQLSLPLLMPKINSTELCYRSRLQAICIAFYL